MAKQKQSPVILALTGASGAQYALRLLECLLGAGTPVYLMVSKAAQIVLSMETELKVPAKPAEMERFFTELYNTEAGQVKVFSQEQWTAPIASGSHDALSMVVCPCTTGTLAAIANGNSDNLLERAADVMLKEKRQLIMVVRETPFSQIHLENMLRLSQAGATIMPANPGFYNKPETLDDIIDFMVSRILDHLNVEHNLQPRWGE
ncbi:MAG: UbiX family flavin prenyltransferase [Gammaproteobacteria bacterium]|nr:UbiX family flavin prenyltransferase [Gammaproteobacteria bacterium]MCW8988298.1 UbiX family flavin prenyltransferase [Gammaproteobacteria bacterium]MCW9032284.1 UbiX family flavin prenyltransferase [Gammaproteobacteria bacterium]